MIHSRWKKIWADFWSNRGRTLLTIVTIAVGGFAVGFNSNLSLYMLESVDTDFLSAQPAEAYIFASEITDAKVKIANEVEGVEAAQGFSIVGANIVQPDGSLVAIRFTAVEDPNQLTVNLLNPAEGEISIPQYGTKEMIIDASARSLGYEPGDTIVIKLDDDRTREIKLVGYMHAAAGFPYNLSNRVNAFVTKDTLEWLGGDIERYGRLAISVSEKQTDQEHVTEVAQAVANRLEDSGSTIFFIDSSQPGHHFAYSVIQGMFFVLGVLGYLTVFLSAFLIVNTITALMTQHTRQIGIMKATGASTAQIFGMYLVLILGFGIGALLLAVPLGNLAAKAAGDGFANWIGAYTVPYKGYTATLIQQIFVTLVVPLLAAILPIYNSIKVTVREALSDYGLGVSAKPKKDSVSESSTLIPRPIRISIRNTFRRKARLGLTLFTLILAGAIFISVYNVWESFDKVIRDIQGYFLADVNVEFSKGYRFDKVASIVESMPGVEGVEGWLEYGGTIKRDEGEAGVQMVFIAPPSSSTLIDPIIIGGRWLEAGDENAVVVGNTFFDDFPDKKIGDWLTIEVNGKDTSWQIVGMYSMPGNTDVQLLYTNYEYISVLVGQPEMVYSLRVITTKHDFETQNNLSEQIKLSMETRGIQLNDISLGAEFIEENTSQTDVLVYFLLAMASMIAVVGGLGLMGTMSINVLERTREIGVMRAIGASNGDIQSIIITEGTVIGILSWAISILVAIPITNLLCFGVGNAMFSSALPAVYGLRGILAWLIFTLVLGTLASAMPARRASKLTVRDTLAYE